MRQSTKAEYLETAVRISSSFFFQRFEVYREFPSFLVKSGNSVCLQVNRKRRQWFSQNEKAVPTSKLGLHTQKSWFCVWRNMTGVVYYELLEHGSTITTETFIIKNLLGLKTLYVKYVLCFGKKKNAILLEDSLLNRNVLLLFAITSISFWHLMKNGFCISIEW